MFDTSCAQQTSPSCRAAVVCPAWVVVFVSATGSRAGLAPTCAAPVQQQFVVSAACKLHLALQLVHMAVAAVVLFVLLGSQGFS